jgi:hypothetical protein
MSEHITPEPDPLSDLLAAPSAPGDGPLRTELLERTRRVLWRRRLGRRAGWAAALAACFAAGLLTMRVLTPRPAAPAEVVRQPETPRHDEPAPALMKEWQAFDSTDRRAELYREAGQRYVKEEGDPESALRCYAQALEAGGPAELALRSDDDWLLMTIKNARQKEIRDANKAN